MSAATRTISTPSAPRIPAAGLGLAVVAAAGVALAAVAGSFGAARPAPAQVPAIHDHGWSTGSGAQAPVLHDHGWSTAGTKSSSDGSSERGGSVLIRFPK